MVAVDSKVKTELLRRYQQLKDDRYSFESNWRNIQTYMLPDHGRNLSGEKETEDTDGADAMGDILDATATEAIDVLSAGLMGGLTSPSRQWFELGIEGDEFEDEHAVKLWLDDLRKRAEANLSKGGAYPMLHHMYTELAGFASACGSVLQDFDTVIRCKPMTIGEFFWSVNSKHEVDTCMREVWMTNRQLVEQFGIENVSDGAKHEYETGNLENRRLVIHVVEPSIHPLGTVDKPIELKDAMERPWRSLYFEKGGNADRLLSVGGFDEFPYLTPRWSVVGGQVYGKGPGRKVLPDVKQLQHTTDVKLTAMDKIADPPVVAPGHPDVNLQVNAMPGGVTYDTSAGTGNPSAGLRPLYQVNPDLGAIYNDILDLRDKIKTGFFNDLFLMIANRQSPQKTATEVAELQAEKLQLLGPFIDRATTEILTPLIERELAIMFRTGSVPPPPAEIEGQDIKIEFVSMLVQAQRAANVGAIEQAAAFLGNISAVAPDVLDRANTDEMWVQYAESKGVPPSLIVPEDEAAAVRSQRAADENMQQGMLAADTIAQTAKTLSETDITQPSMLDPVAESLPGLTGGA